MIAFVKPDPREIIDEPCECCQAGPSNLVVGPVPRGECPYDPLAELEEYLDDLEPQPLDRRSHVLAAVLLIVAAVVFHLSGLASMPSPWAWLWFLFGASSCSLAGIVVGMALAEE